MKVLKASINDYNELNGFQIGVHKIEFIKDADNNWITAVEVKSNPAFEAILNQLNELEEIEYNPIIEVEND